MAIMALAITAMANTAMANMAMAVMVMAIMAMDHGALKPTPTSATGIQRLAAMLVMIQWVAGTATMKPRTGVSMGMTTMAAGWVLGARTKAWEAVQLPMADPSLRLVKMSAPM